MAIFISPGNNFNTPILLDGSAGTSDQIVASQGISLPAKWVTASRIVVLTQAAYDALSPKDSAAVYFIKATGSSYISAVYEGASLAWRDDRLTSSAANLYLSSNFI